MSNEFKSNLNPKYTFDSFIIGNSKYNVNITVEKNREKKKEERT